MGYRIDGSRCGGALGVEPDEQFARYKPGFGVFCKRTRVCGIVETDDLHLECVTLPIAQPKPQKPASKPPSARPLSPSSPGGSKQKPSKNKLTRPPREEERKNYYSPPVPSPGTGSLNAAPPPPPSAGSSAPKFPQPNTLYSSYTAPTPAAQSPGGPAYSYSHPNVQPAPPPPPPTNFLAQFTANNAGNDAKHSKTSSITNMATSTAQTLVSGVFDKLNKRK